MDYLNILHDWGVVGLLLLFFIDKVWPGLFGVFAKQKQTELDAKLENMRLEQARDAEAAKADREARQAERAFRHEADMKQSEANLRLATAFDKVAEGIAKHNEQTAMLVQQMTQTGAGVSALTTFLVGYTADMRVSVTKLTEMVESNSSDLQSLIIRKSAFETGQLKQPQQTTPPQTGKTPRNP